MMVAAWAPAIFLDGQGLAAIYDPERSSNLSGNGSRPSATVSVYLTGWTGQGDVTNRPATGATAASDPLSRVMVPVEASIGDKPVDVQFAGLAPGFVGLLQVNLRIPELPTGNYPLIFRIGGAYSNPATVSIW